jgi:hypothetical protein
MSSSRIPALLGGGALLLMTSLSHAACTKDTECKGDRVCDAGQCVKPSPATPPAAAAPAPAAAPALASAPALTPPTAEAPASEPTQPKMQRHSSGMMAGGIVMVSLAPVALLVSGIAGLGKSVCSIDNPDRYDSCDEYNPALYGGLLSALVLVGVGIPMIVIGAKKEPVDAPNVAATVSPWVAPSAAGLSLRVDM